MSPLMRRVAVGGALVIHAMRITITDRGQAVVLVALDPLRKGHSLWPFRPTVQGLLAQAPTPPNVQQPVGQIRSRSAAS
jgi:hypothetical protein